MRSAVIHGLLLAVMLIYGYRTWTRDKTVKPDLGSVQLWKKDDSELASIEYKNAKKTVRLERKGTGKDGYWWGTETTTEKKPKIKPADPKPATPGSGSGSAGSGSGSAKAGSGSGSAVAAGSGSAKAGSGSGSAVAAGSGSAKAGSGSNVAAGSGSAKAGSGSGSGSAVAAGSGSGSGSAATPPPPVEMVETTKVREFPLGDGGDKIVKAFSDAHAIGDLGKPSAEQLVDYKLANKDQVETKLADVKKELEAVKAQDAKDKEEDDKDKDKDPKDKKKPKKDDKKPELTKKIKELEDQKKAADQKTTLVVKFADGSTREFLVGGSVFGGSDRYVLDQQSGSAYVLSKEMVSGLEVGESSLQLTDPKGFPIADIEGVEVEWNGRKKAAKRLEAPDASGKQVKTWTDMDTGKPNQPLATFIDNINNMRPVEYSKDVKVEGAPIYRLTYKDAKGGQLGTLSLYKLEKPPVIPDGVDFDPANPPKGEIEYYVVTERTRVPALVRPDGARKSEEDLPIVFGDKAAPAAPPKPGANPFGAGVKPVPGGGVKPPGAGSASPHGMFGGSGSAKPAEGGGMFGGGSGKP